jgi:ribosomal protein L37AE/L43A
MQAEKHYEYRRGQIAVLDSYSSRMQCQECGTEWIATLKSGGGFHRGCWTCFNCGANSKGKYNPNALHD